MRNLAHFSLGNIIKNLNGIFVSINTQHSRPFPKPECFLLSHYRYERRYIKIDRVLSAGVRRVIFPDGEEQFSVRSRATRERRDRRPARQRGAPSVPGRSEVQIN